MPNYEYQCTACNHRFELWQNVGDAAPECPECGQSVRKVFHVPRVIFKGSGFYVTDLRAEKGGNGGSKSESSSSEKTSTPESTSSSTTESTSSSTSNGSTTPSAGDSK